MSNDRKTMAALRTEFMLDITQRLERLFLESNFNPADAKKISIDFALKLSHDWQSQLIYIPKNFCFLKSIEHTHIREQFTGNNHHALSVRFNRDLRTIYKILGQS